MSHPLNSLLSIADQTRPYKKALSTGRLPNQSFSPEVENFGLQNALADEFEERIGMEQRAGAQPNEIQGLQKLLGIRQQNIAESPILAQRKENDAFREAEQSAINEGFGGDQIMTQFGNTWESKGASPLQNKRRELMEMQRYQIDAPARNARAQAEEQGKWAMRRDMVNQGALASNQQNFLESIRQLRGAQPGAPSQIDRVGLPTKSGGGSVSFDTTPNPTVSTGIARALAQARSQVDLAQTDEQKAGAKSQLDSLAASYISNYPVASPEISSFVMNIYQNGTGGYSVDELLEIVEPGFATKHPVSASQIKDMFNQLGIK